jgi:hypothetical protein
MCLAMTTTGSGERILLPALLPRYITKTPSYSTHPRE